MYIILYFDKVSEVCEDISICHFILIFSWTAIVKVRSELSDTWKMFKLFLKTRGSSQVQGFMLCNFFEFISLVLHDLSYETWIMNPNWTDVQIKAQLIPGLINLKWFLHIVKNKRIIVVCVLAGTRKTTMLIFVVNYIYLFEALNFQLLNGLYLNTVYYFGTCNVLIIN